jgi:hypothetical protein
MNIAKPAAVTAVFLVGMLVCEYAWADPETDQLKDEEYARLPVCTLNAEGTKLAVEPCRRAPTKEPMPRRSVTQIIQPMPQVKRAPQVAMPTAPPSPALPSLSNRPVPVTSCDAGGCYGANGVRYNNAGGGVVAPSGKVCNRSGATIQC